MIPSFTYPAIYGVEGPIPKSIFLVSSEVDSLLLNMLNALFISSSRFIVICVRVYDSELSLTEVILSMSSPYSNAYSSAC